jgi:branched-subunit amino acid transport protein
VSVAVLIAGCAATTFILKALGPMVLGGRELPAWFTNLVTLLAPALLAALVATQVFADGSRLQVGAHTVGVGVAGLVAWRTHSFLACVVTAAVVTAVLRLITG